MRESLSKTSISPSLSRDVTATTATVCSGKKQTTLIGPFYEIDNTFEKMEEAWFLALACTDDRGAFLEGNGRCFIW